MKFTFKEVEEMEELFVESMDAETALDALLRAMDVDTKGDLLEYIIRVYELKEEEEEE